MKREAVRVALDNGEVRKDALSLAIAGERNLTVREKIAKPTNYLEDH